MKNKTILIIEDDELIREMLKMFYDGEGFETHVASNGLEGFNVLKKINKPCLILLDLMMPVMDGWEFLSLYNKTASNLKAPVVVISAFADQAKKINADGFINKPIDLEILSRITNQFCN